MAKTQTILILDDETLPRALLITSLTEAGYVVHEANSGQAALDLMRSQLFDLVLLDLVMPKMDGFQVLKQMKSNDLLRDIPVIVVSASEDMESVVRCVEMGAVDHLSKPFDPVLLHVRIRAALAAHEFRKVGFLQRAAVPPGGTHAALKPEELEAAEKEPGTQMGIMGFLRTLFRYLVPYRKPAILLVVLLLISLAIEAVLPLGFKFITDDALLVRNFQALLLILTVVVLAFFAVVLTELGSDYVFARLPAKVMNDLRYDMYRHLQRLSMGFYMRVPVGDIMSRFTTDLAAVEYAVLISLPIVLSESVMVVFGLALLFMLEWKLALFSVIGLYVSYKSGQRNKPFRTARSSHWQGSISCVFCYESPTFERR